MFNFKKRFHVLERRQNKPRIRHLEFLLNQALGWPLSLRISECFWFWLGVPWKATMTLWIPTASITQVKHIGATYSTTHSADKWWFPVSSVCSGTVFCTCTSGHVHKPLVTADAFVFCLVHFRSVTSWAFQGIFQVWFEWMTFNSPQKNIGQCVVTTIPNKALIRPCLGGAVVFRGGLKPKNSPKKNILFASSATNLTNHQNMFFGDIQQLALPYYLLSWAFSAASNSNLVGLS